MSALRKLIQLGLTLVFLGLGLLYLVSAVQLMLSPSTGVVPAGDPMRAAGRNFSMAAGLLGIAAMTFWVFGNPRPTPNQDALESAVDSSNKNV